MSSIIEGYNYDIFISYRQKDNKGDRWVSEFVEALKTELESTFKEEISVYFDINPHDGLLETHDVDASLKEKLKCLVFIPIISRTYCDPKSFAWEYEFKAFVEQASKDKFGLKVKLANGNITTRIFPILIHDLKPEDKILVEKELGGFLRAIEFIYKEPGVNRPLTVRDSEDKNTYKTNFRNQINKVSNAIDEIVGSLKNLQFAPMKEKPRYIEPLQEVKKEKGKEVQEKPSKLSERKVLIGSIASAFLLVVAASLVYPKIFTRDTLEKLRSSGEKISVAVMPFQNMTNDTTWNVWQEAIQNELITTLTNSKELKVRQVESITDLIQSKGLTNYTSITPSIASRLSLKLDANVFIFGTIKQDGSTIRLNAQLIDSKTKETFGSLQTEGPSKEENIFHLIDSLSTKVKNYLIVSKLIKEEDPDIQKKWATISSPQALRILMYGEKAFAKADYPTAINMYLQVLAIDSTIVIPFLSITWAYFNQGLYVEARKWYLKTYEKEYLMSRAEKLDATVLHAYLYETPYDVIKCLRQQQEFDDQNPIVYNDLGVVYSNLPQYDKAVPEFKKSLEIYSRWGVKPFWIFNYTGLGWAYYKTGQYKKAKEVYKKAERDFPPIYPNLFRQQAILSLTERDTIAANRYIDKYRSIGKDLSWPEADITRGLAGIYSEANILDKAEKYFRQALSLEPENPVRLNTLAHFLIDKDLNLDEGLELVDMALVLSPDNYDYLDTKGLGLYKLGKYVEAHEILQESWHLRMENAIYNYEAFLHLEAAKKTLTSQKNN